MSEQVQSQILETAARLFFEQGFANTGINQLIEESGVARRTFYRYFVSKEVLGVAYLDLAAARWLSQLQGACEGMSSPARTTRALFRYLEDFATATNYRGCGLLNMTAEFADVHAGARQSIKRHKQSQRHLIRALLGEHQIPRQTSDCVHVLVEGAIAATAAHLETWPIRAACYTSLVLVRKTSNLSESG